MEISPVVYAGRLLLQVRVLSRYPTLMYLSIYTAVIIFASLPHGCKLFAYLTTLTLFAFACINHSLHTMNM